jgi:hypothetical protein
VSEDVHDDPGRDLEEQQQARCGVPGVVQPGVVDACVDEQRLPVGVIALVPSGSPSS